MRTGRVLAVALLLALVGCTAPTAKDMVSIDRGKEEATILLDSFAKALRDKDASQLKPLFTPSTLAMAETKFEQASWLLKYRGYTLQSAAGLDRVKWQSWVAGRLIVAVPGHNFQNDQFQDVFEMRCVEGKWYLCDFTLSQPVPGALLDPPEDVMAQLRPDVHAIMDDIENGHPGNVVYRLPKEARFRAPELSWWEKFWAGDKAGVISIFDDVKLVQQFYVPRWPAPEEPFEITYEGAGIIRASYEFLYNWPERKIVELDTMTVEILFRRVPQGWELAGLRLKGEAFPYT